MCNASVSRLLKFVCLVILFLLAVPVAARADLVGLWRFDSTDPLAANIIPNGVLGGAPGVLTNGPTLVLDADKGVNVLSTDGGSQNVYCGYVQPLATTDNYTWAFWAKESASQAVNDEVIVGNRYNGGTGSNAWVKFTPHQFEYYYAGTNNAINYTDINNNNTWHYYAVVKSGSTMTYYCDGVAGGTATATVSMPALPFFVGGDPGECWAGRIKDVALFNQALTTTELASVQNGNFSAYTAIPAGKTAVASDNFSPGPINSSKWSVISKGLEHQGSGTQGTVTANVNNSGQLVISGTGNTGYWGGISLLSQNVYSTTSPLTVNVDRISLSGIGILRSSLWLWSDDTHFLHFSQNYGENGWSYNYADGSTIPNSTGGGVNLSALDALDTNLGAHDMKLVFTPGSIAGQATVGIYLDNILAGSQSFTNWNPSTMQIMLSGMPRDNGNLVTAVFDNLNAIGNGFQWRGASSSSWADPNNWDAAGTPDNNAAVVFGNDGAGATVDMGGVSRTLSQMTFNAVGTTIQGGGGLVLDNGSNPALVSAAGTHAIDASVPVSLNSAAIVNVATGGALTVNGNVNDGANGANGISKSGGGLLVLRGANGYSGGTTVNAGVVRFDANTAIPDTGDITVNAGGTAGAGGTATAAAVLAKIATYSAGALGITGTNTNIESLDFTAYGSLSLGAIDSATYDGVLTPAADGIYRLGGLAGTLTYQSVLADDGGAWRGLIVQGNVILASPNTYSGDTTVNAGTLTLGNTGAIPSGSGKGNVAVSGGATLNLAGFDLGVNGLSGGGTITNNRTTAGTNTLTAGLADADGDFSGVIQDGSNGTVALRKTGAGTLTLRGANTFSGNVTINSGTLQMGSTSALGNAANTVTVQPGATLDVTGARTLGSQVVTISGAGVGDSGAVVSSASGSANAGVVRLELAADATIGGATRWDIRDGGNRGYFDAHGFTLTKTGVNEITFYNISDISLSDLVINQGSANFEQNSPLGDASKTITVNSGGELWFWDNTAPALDKNVVLSGGTLRNDGGGGHAVNLVGPVTLTGTNAVQANVDIALSGAVSGTGGLTKNGGAVLTLANAANAYEGGTTLTAGTLAISDDSNLGATSGGLTFNGGTLRVTGTGTSGLDPARPLAWGTAGGKFEIADAAKTFTVPQSVPDSGGLTKSGAGNLVLSGTNTYGGDTTVNAGTLAAGSPGAIPSGLGAGNLVVNAGATFDLNGVSPTVNALLGKGVVTNNPAVPGASNTLTVGQDGGSSSLTATLQDGTGKLALTKNGSGTLKLGAFGAYTGPTTISGGTIQLGPAIAATSWTGTGTPNALTGPSLIAGLTPTAMTNTWAGQEGTGGISLLTNGDNPGKPAGSNGNANWYTIGPGASLTYTLPTSDTGYNISNINLFSDWNDNGRTEIPLAGVYYSTVAAPTTFLPIAGTAVDYVNASPTFQNEVMFSATGGVMAAGVYAIRFDFATGTGPCGTSHNGYGEIEVLGSLLGASSNLLPTSAPLQIAAGGTFDLAGASQQVASLDDFDGSGGVVTSNGDGNSVLTLGSAGTPPSTLAAFSGVIQDHDVGVGAGTLALVVDSANLTQTLSGTSTYSGGTIVKNGTLQIGSAGALPGGMPLTIGADASVAAAASSAAAVPEPGTIALLAAGLGAVLLAAWRRRRQG
jgi:fibronectin-binding autotransporter adhesin